MSEDTLCVGVPKTQRDRIGVSVCFYLDIFSERTTLIRVSTVGIDPSQIEQA